MAWELADTLSLEDAWELDDFLADEAVPPPRPPLAAQRGGLRSPSTQQQQTLNVAAKLAVACPRPTRQVVSGFPPYKSTFTSLPKEEQNKVAAVAALIKARFQRGCEPSLEISLIGHADRGTRPDPAYDKRISLERATTVKEALARFINDGSVLSRIRWQGAGAGSDSMVVPNPKSESERLRNRRVEIILGPLPLDGVVVGVTVDERGATLRLLIQLPRAGEFEYELYRNDPGSPAPLLPRTEWMRRGAMVGLAQRALGSGNRVRLLVAADTVQSLEVYKP